MQTQSVSMALVNTKAGQSGRRAEAIETASFDNVLTKSSSKEGGTSDKAGLSEKKKEIQNFSSEKKLPLETSKSEISKDDISNSSQEMEVSEMLHEAEQFLKDVFSMSKEDFEHLLETLGIPLLELLIPGEGDTCQLGETAFENLKQLVMEFHGLEDKAVFLVNPDLMNELEQLKAGLEDILNVQGFTSSKQFLEFVQEKLAMKDPTAQSDVNTEVSEETQVMTDTDKIQVTVEQENAKGSDSGMEFTTSAGTKTVENYFDEAKGQLADAFVEKLGQAFCTSGSEQAVGTPGNMTDIVRQVVNHIRIRVLPETTSMELSLHPESLGRVNISVSQSGGVTTATMLVQSEAAKEALESQIVTLKETFEEKGLKVESVEVMVSDFSFKEEDSRKGAFAQEKKTNGRRIRMDEIDESADETEVKSEEIILDGRTIDYTA